MVQIPNIFFLEGCWSVDSSTGSHYVLRDPKVYAIVKRGLVFVITLQIVKTYQNTTIRYCYPQSSLPIDSIHKYTHSLQSYLKSLIKFLQSPLYQGFTP